MSDRQETGPVPAGADTGVGGVRASTGNFPGLTIIRHSPDPDHPDAQRIPPRSIADKLRTIDQSRLGALLLVIATIAAIIWANASIESYDGFWDTRFTIGIADMRIDFTLHSLVNDALMAFFFFVVGLEVRREFAIGELTSWSRALVPAVAAVFGLAVPAGLYLLIAAGSGAEHAWGVVISTDTAFLVGALALIGPRSSGRLRVFLLALAVVDDIGALSIIAIFYTEDFSPWPLLAAAVALALVYFTRYLRGGRGPIYALLAVIVWLAFLAAGVHPTLAGVAIALLVPVYRPSRRDVEHALELARIFRQSPNTQYAKAAANSLRESISINERLQSAYAPYVSYVILPIFALANAGVQVDGHILATAITSPVTWAVIVGLVAGKFIGIFGSTRIMRLLKIGDFGPGLTIDRIAGGSLLAGIGFTISLFIVDIAIPDEVTQNSARVGVLAASILAFLLATVAFRLSDRFTPEEETGRYLLRPVDHERDHVWGRPDAPYTLVEYGDFQCEFCLRASGATEEVIRELGDQLRYVWRHAPLTRFHPNALAAAEASEAAALQGRFFEYARALFVHDQAQQLPRDLIRRAEELGLDIERFERDLASAEVTARVRDDMLDAEAMQITAVPTFFVNGRRHVGPYDARTLVRALLETGPAQPPNAADGARLDGPRPEGDNQA